MKNTILNKTELVNSVFSSVSQKYDLMNDIMSFGVHRIWKEKFIDWMNPSENSKLIDVASGTGDIAKLFSNLSNEQNLHFFFGCYPTGLSNPKRQNRKKDIHVQEDIDSHTHVYKLMN
mgnify:CR=1 FL=1